MADQPNLQYHNAVRVVSPSADVMGYAEQLLDLLSADSGDPKTLVNNDPEFNDGSGTDRLIGPIAGGATSVFFSLLADGTNVTQEPHLEWWGVDDNKAMIPLVNGNKAHTITLDTSGGGNLKQADGSEQVLLHDPDKYVVDALGMPYVLPYVKQKGTGPAKMDLLVWFG
jgi:hypothetical protein